MAERAIVFGATGGLGSAVVAALLRRGIAVRAVGRDLDRLREALPEEGVEAVIGDAFDRESAARAAQGCTLVFHCVNMPYVEWARQPALVESLLNAAESAGARFVFPGNVYVYGRAKHNPVREDHPQEPHTVKGPIRVAIERSMLDAHRQGRVPVVIGRFPDFYGPRVRNTITDSMFFGTQSGRPVVWPGNPNLPHQFIFNDDAAETLVRLALEPDAYGQAWHVPGPGAVTAHEWADMLGDALGKTISVRVYPAWLLRVVGLFDAGTRAFNEMKYLWDEPLILDGSKYRERFGPAPETPHPLAIRRTFEWAGAQLPPEK